MNKNAERIAALATVAVDSIDEIVAMYKTLQLILENRLKESPEAQQQMEAFLAAGPSSTGVKGNLLETYIDSIKNNDRKGIEASYEQLSKLSASERPSVQFVNVDPRYAKILFDLCDKHDPRIGYLPIEVTSENGEKMSQVAIHSAQENVFRSLAMESMIRIGYNDVVPMSAIDQEIVKGAVPKETIGKNLSAHENPLIKIEGMDYEKYLALRDNIRKLNPEARFSLIVGKPQEKDGKTVIDIAYPSKKEVSYDRIGDSLEKPMEINVRKLMGSMLVATNFAERGEHGEENLSILSDREKFRNQQIDNVLKNKSVTVNTMREFVKRSENLTNAQKLELDKKMVVMSYYTINSREFAMAKDDLMKTLDKMKGEPELDRTIDRVKDISSKLGKESTIIPVKMVTLDNGKVEYQPVDDMTIKVGRELTIKRKGRKKEDIVTDEKSMKKALDEELRGIQSRSVPTDREGKDQFIFVELSAAEAEKLMNKDPEMINDKGVLNPKSVKFIADHQKELVKMQQKTDEHSKMARAAIDKINETIQSTLAMTDGNFEEPEKDGITYMESILSDALSEKSTDHIVRTQEANEQSEITDQISEIQYDVYEASDRAVEEMETTEPFAQQGIEEIISDMNRENEDRSKAAPQMEEPIFGNDDHLLI